MAKSRNKKTKAKLKKIINYAKLILIDIKLRDIKRTKQFLNGIITDIIILNDIHPKKYDELNGMITKLSELIHELEREESPGRLVTEANIITLCNAIISNSNQLLRQL